MSGWFASLRTRLAVPPGPSARAAFQREQQDELESHVAFRTDDLISQGIAPEEARRRARAELGGVDALTEACGDASWMRWPDELWRNLVAASRLIRQGPGAALTVVVTLGLCIGANTAIFSVVDAVLLRPLPFAEPERLEQVTLLVEQGGRRSESISVDGATWEAVRKVTKLDVAVYSGWPAGINIVAGNRVDYVQRQRVGAGFFGVLGVEPRMGREFVEAEDRPGGPPVVVLGHELWSRKLGGDPDLVGNTILVGGEPHTVIGIMPPGFHTGTSADLWTPLRAGTSGEGEGNNYGVVARPHAGVSREEAAAELAVVGQAAIDQMEFAPGTIARVQLMPLRDGLTGSLRGRLLLLWGAVGLVLAIGCINIAGLLLARSAGRRREIATRMALGGGKAAILRQLLTESLLLGAAGGALGILLGSLAMTGLRTWAHDALGVWQDVRLDGRVLAATVLLSLATSLAFGLVPAWRATRVRLNAELEIGGRGVTRAIRTWPRRMLLMAQVALAFVLLVGSGLLVRTFLNLQNLRPGFDATNVMTAGVSLKDARYDTGEKANRLFDDALERIRALPGIESAAVALNLPYERPLNVGFQRLDPGHERTITNLTYVTPDYFRVLRIPLERGRLFEASDDAAGPKVVVVNHRFVEQHFAGEDPLGARIAISGEERVIVGVIGDTQQRPGWGNFGPLSPMPNIFMPAAQTAGDFMGLVHTWFEPSFLVRATRLHSGLVQGMQRALAETDPLLPFSSFRSMEEVRAGSMSRERFQAALMSGLAALALILAAVGIAGLIAYSVTERTREIGIRMALGASRLRVVGEAALPGVGLTLIGVGIGLVGARFAVRSLRELVFGVATTDSLTFAAVAALLLGVALVASFVPALRVMRLDPAHTLRHE